MTIFLNSCVQFNWLFWNEVVENLIYIIILSFFKNHCDWLIVQRVLQFGKLEALCEIPAEKGDIHFYLLNYKLWTIISNNAQKLINID